MFQECSSVSSISPCTRFANMPKDTRLDMLVEVTHGLKLSQDSAFGAITQSLGEWEAAFHESVRYTETRLQSFEQKLDYISEYCKASNKSEADIVRSQLASESFVVVAHAESKERISELKAAVDLLLSLHATPSPSTGPEMSGTLPLDRLLEFQETVMAATDVSRNLEPSTALHTDVADVEQAGSLTDAAPGWTPTGGGVDSPESSLQDEHDVGLQIACGRENLIDSECHSHTLALTTGLPPKDGVPIHGESSADDSSEGGESETRTEDSCCSDATHNAEEKSKLQEAMEELCEAMVSWAYKTAITTPTAVAGAPIRCLQIFYAMERLMALPNDLIFRVTALEIEYREPERIVERHNLAAAILDPARQLSVQLDLATEILGPDW